MYGRQYGRGGFQADMGRIFRRDGAPLTIGLIAANVMTFLIGFFLMGTVYKGAVDYFLGFSNTTFPTFFWTLVTWPVAAPLDLIGLLFSSLAFFWFGGSLERSWGTRVFAGFLAATAVVTALTLYLGGLLLHAGVHAGGLYLASAPPLIAWAALNRRETINVYGILPVPAPIIAWVTVGLTWFGYSAGAQNPLLGLFALSGCGLAYWYATKGRFAAGSFSSLRGDDRPRRTSIFSQDTKSKPTSASREDIPKADTGSFNPLRRLKEERERKEREKKLEDMFRRSGYDDKG